MKSKVKDLRLVYHQHSDNYVLQMLVSGKDIMDEYKWIDVPTVIKKL